MAKRDYIIVSLSGGKDSTAILLRMIELGEHIDEVIFCDSTVEFPTMYIHIQKLRELSEKNGIRFTTLVPEHDFEWWMFEKPVHSKKWGDHYGYGWPLSSSRWCNQHLKVRVIHNYLSPLKKKYNIIQCVGLAYDEKEREAKVSNHRLGRRYPLIEWGWTEKDCLEYCYSKGYDWGGLYRLFGRTSCWCCPLQPIDSLRSLYRYYPDLWKKLEEWEDRLSKNAIFYVRFKADCYSVHALSHRFAMEVRGAKYKESTRQKRIEEFY